MFNSVDSPSIASKLRCRHSRMHYRPGPSPPGHSFSGFTQNVLRMLGMAAIASLIIPHKLASQTGAHHAFSGLSLNCDV